MSPAEKQQQLIARYAGMTQRTFGEDVKEYLQLDFAGTDKIFLPADQIGRITRYSGGPAPALSTRPTLSARSSSTLVTCPMVAIVDARRGRSVRRG